MENRESNLPIVSKEGKINFLKKLIGVATIVGILYVLIKGIAAGKYVS